MSLKKFRRRLFVVFFLFAPPPFPSLAFLRGAESDGWMLVCDPLGYISITWYCYRCVYLYIIHWKHGTWPEAASTRRRVFFSTSAGTTDHVYGTRVWRRRRHWVHRRRFPSYGFLSLFPPLTLRPNEQVT